MKFGIRRRTRSLSAVNSQILRGIALNEGYSFVIAHPAHVVKLFLRRKFSCFKCKGSWAFPERTPWCPWGNRCMTTRRKPDGGFRFIGAYDLLGVYFAYSSKLIRWYDVRVWFACQEAVARRCGVKKGIPMRYREEEIATLVGGARGKHVRAALRRLESAGIMCWSEAEVTFPKAPEDLTCDDLSGFWTRIEDFAQANRKVPVPRRTIRFIASGARKVLTATMLGHLFRCCYFRRGEYSAEGSCSAAWVGRVFDLDERNVKIARNHLVFIGWLVPVRSHGWHRQRYGGRNTVNPTWSRRSKAKESTASGETVAPVDSMKRSPQIAVLEGKRSPLLILKENSFGSRNQKPASAADRPTGFCKKQIASGTPPTWKHVVVEDLRDTARTLRLFDDAVEDGFVRRCEADRLKVVAAAERALRVADKNPCGFFVKLVRGKLWHHVNQDEEERARVRIRRHTFERTPLVAVPFVFDARPSEQLSMDAKVVAAVKRTLARHRVDVDPFEALRGERPDWTYERWLRAETELVSPRSARIGVQVNHAA